MGLGRIVNCLSSKCLFNPETIRYLESTVNLFGFTRPLAVARCGI